MKARAGGQVQRKPSMEARPFPQSAPLVFTLALSMQTILAKGGKRQLSHGAGPKGEELGHSSSTPASPTIGSN